MVNKFELVWTYLASENRAMVGSGLSPHSAVVPWVGISIRVSRDQKVPTNKT